MSRRSAVIALTLVSSLLAIIATPAPGSSSDGAVPFDSGRWQVDATEHAFEPHLGRPSLRLKGGVAWVEDSDVHDGVIEFDIAFTGARGFMGGIWRMQDRHNYEEFYMRPHQSGFPDANQYTPVFDGDSGWQLYHGEGYGSAVQYRNDTWQHVQIVFSGSRGEVFIDSDEPVLVMHELKREPRSGRVGLSASNFAPAWFSNFSYRGEAPALRGTPVEPKPAPEGTVQEWAVSSGFADESLAGGELPAALLNALSWSRLPAEATGITNLARVQALSPETNTVLAGLTIESDQEQRKALRFGYSDLARVYLNGELLYSGQRMYQSRDYRYLGTIGLFDELILPLRAGTNELRIAVLESFGGWGIVAQIPDRTGIRVEAR